MSVAQHPTFLRVIIYDFRLLEDHYGLGLQDVSHKLDCGDHCDCLGVLPRDRDLALSLDHRSGGGDDACPRTYDHLGDRDALGALVCGDDRSNVMLEEVEVCQAQSSHSPFLDHEHRPELNRLQIRYQLQILRAQGLKLTSSS